MKSATWKTSNLPYSLAAFARDIKISHSIFALPFAASVFFLLPLPAPTFLQATLLIIAMVCARSFAMGYNRFADRLVDYGNPRTRTRAIPSGDLKPAQAMAWIVLSGLGLVVSSFALNPVAGYCSFPLLAILAFYSYWKKFSYGCHWYLGMCLGLAPVAVCVAMTGEIPAAVLALALAITSWTAGFDILYALQDEAYDRDVGLKSIPSRFGTRTSIWISRACFGGMVLCLVALGVLTARSPVYFIGIAGIAAFLSYEHYLIRHFGRACDNVVLGKAFFNQNAYVSVFFLLLVILDVVL